MKNPLYSFVSKDIMLNELNRCSGLDAISFVDFTNKCDGAGWHNLDSWESLDDINILNFLTADNKPNGELYIVNEVSYKMGAFLINYLNLTKLVSNHLSLFGECFFNGDVVILQKDRSTVWVFNHDGFYKVISFLE